MKLLFSPEARDDLVRLREFIRIHNPQAAARAAQSIIEVAQRLIAFPKCGVSVGKSGDYRDIVFAFGAGGYVLRYKITANAIHILRIWHMKERRS